MSIPASLLDFMIGPHRLQAYVPDIKAMQEYYLQGKKNNDTIPFPYWSQVWPAALGLCEYLEKHLDILKDKKIIELGAGIGLPSLLAARYAKEVCVSDYVAEAVELIQRSVLHNQLQNVQCRLLNWNEIPGTITADVILLSDVNYDPGSFDELYETLLGFLYKGTILILSTPQRLMAKPFIEQLLPFCKDKAEIPVLINQQETLITVMMLKQ
jgi:predicted nicotinamide N-methyase